MRPLARPAVLADLIGYRLDPPSLPFRRVRPAIVLRFGGAAANANPRVKTHSRCPASTRSPLPCFDSVAAAATWIAELRGRP